MVRIIISTTLCIILIHTAVALVTDVKTGKIPNVWNTTVGIGGIGYHIMTGGWEGLLFSLFGMTAISIATIILYVCSAVGGGDVKWFAALGAWSGVTFTMMTFFYSMMIAGVIGLIVLIAKRRLFRLLGQWFVSIYFFALFKNKAHLRVLQRQSVLEMPLMLAISPAVVIVCTGITEGSFG